MYYNNNNRLILAFYPNRTFTAKFKQNIKEITITFKEEPYWWGDQCFSEGKAYISITTTAVDAIEITIHGYSNNSDVKFPVKIWNDGDKQLYSHDYEERDFSSQNIIDSFASELINITIKVNGTTIIDKYSLHSSLSLSGQLKGKIFESGNYRVTLQ